MLRVIRELRPTWVIGENVAGIASMGEPIGDVSVESRQIIRNEEMDSYEAVYLHEERMLLYRICQELEEEGYEVQPVIFPASAVGAYHQRQRTFILGHSKRSGCDRQPWRRAREKPADRRMEFETRRKDATHPNGQREQQRQRQQPKSRGRTDDGYKKDVTNSDRTERNEYNNAGIRKEKALVSGRNYPAWAGGEWEMPYPLRDGLLNHDFVGWMMGFPQGWAHSISPKEQIKAYGNAVVPQQAYPIFEAIAKIERMAQVKQ